MTTVLSAQRVAVAGRLAPLSLTLSPGDVHALVGPNGCGKSTFLDCVLGLQPFDGTLSLLDGMTVAMVPQAFTGSSTSAVTVLELLAASRTTRPSWLGLSARVRQQCLDALALTNAAGLAPARLATLSGGELRRVLLADALAKRPGLLLLDEPEAGLDDASRVTLERALTDARASGVTTLWVSHDAAAVQRLATHTTRVGAPA
ncbi:MAG: ATP-binding cassette domain-containing protein [Myxococcaceae bacterium]|nr:ATP-binding cassette domain-containing protein [Myxococcaceae bacterium]